MPGKSSGYKNHFTKRPWIKVCGFTQVNNAVECTGLDPDAVGFVFYKKSPRYVAPSMALKISKAIPDHILTVGVFVDDSFDRIMKIVEQSYLKGVQLHGNESPNLVSRLRKENLIVIKALFAKRAPLLSQADEYRSASFFLVEYGKGILPGGNAESWEYELSNQMKTDIPVILAGGLTPKNVCQAVNTAMPFGVDVSSGVEQRYGIKDYKKVKSFITKLNSSSLQHCYARQTGCIKSESINPDI